MTATAFIRSADLKRMAAVVQTTKVCIELEIEGTTVRISPDTPPPLKKFVAKPVELEL